MSRSPQPNSQRGVALITALLVTSIVAIIAVGMASRQQIDIRRTGNVLEIDQAYLYALGVESWAQSVLASDLRNDQKPANQPVDTLKEPWAQELAPVQVEGGQIAGQIEDLQGRFNVNNLAAQLQPDVANPQNPPVDPALQDKQIFYNLLVFAGAKAEQARSIVIAVTDWIDADQSLRIPDGAEDQDYERLTPPYRAANAPLTSISELLLVKGMTGKIYAALAPNIAALPVGVPEQPFTATAININTAPGAVLAAIAGEPSLGETLVRARLAAPRPFSNTQELLQQLPSLNPALITPNLSVSSQYFLLTASARAGRRQVQLHSVLHRLGSQPGAQSQPKIAIEMRGQGTY